MNVSGRPHPVPVKLQTDPVLKYAPYYDSHNVVAAAEVQVLPDLIFRNGFDGG